MKTTLLKISGACALLLVSAGAFAASHDCCGDMVCCLKAALSCCF